MIIGKSDRRITIERATETTNGYGEKVASWATLITVWAELQKTSGMRESIDNRQDTARQQLNFKIRSSTDSRAVTTVKAMGWNILPSTPVSAKIGT